MMKTSYTQFQAMLAYMERHGDLTSRQPDLRKKIPYHWDQLSIQLNRLGGVSKTPTQWRKVWTDFKSNTKKKDIKLSKGNTAVRLNELEERALVFTKNEHQSVPSPRTSWTPTADDRDPLDTHETAAALRKLWAPTKKEKDVIEIDVEIDQTEELWAPTQDPKHQPNVNSAPTPVMGAPTESQPSTSKSSLKTYCEEKETELPKLSTEEFHAKWIKCYTQQLRQKREEIGVMRQRNIQRRRFEEEMVKLVKKLIDSVEKKDFF